MVTQKLNTNNPSFRGEIVHGRGMGKGTIESLSSFLRERNIVVFPGTLNLVFSNPVFLDESKAKYSYNQLFFFWEAKLNGIDCFAYRWRKCPHHIIEIVAFDKLRDQLKLDDNHKVIIEIHRKNLMPFSFWRLLYWNMAWRGRCKIYYTNDTYFKIISLMEAAANRTKKIFFSYLPEIKHNTKTI